MSIWKLLQTRMNWVPPTIKNFATLRRFIHSGVLNIGKTDDCVKFCGPSFGMYIACIHLHPHLHPFLLSLSPDALNGVYDVSYSAGVTFGDWKAKDGECNKCSSGGAGPITLERKCKPKKAEHSCDGLNTTMEAQDCLKYCDSSAGM